MKILAFGESLLRLRAPFHERLLQSASLEATFGGGESNVAVSLANYGVDAEYFTILPDHALGDACIRELRKFGVRTDRIRREAGRMGLYFLEAGSNYLPGKVIYDRADSAIAKADPGSIDWNELLRGKDVFHVSGITAAISENAMQMCMDGVRTAVDMGITVSCDFNHRKLLWQYGRTVNEVMTELMKYVTIVNIGPDDITDRLNLGIPKECSEGFGEGFGEECTESFGGEHTDKCGEGFGEECSKKTSEERGKDPEKTGKGLEETEKEKLLRLDRELIKHYPGMKLIANTSRNSQSAERNLFKAYLYDGSSQYESHTYEILDIVDRVGGGDSFMAGLLFGLFEYKDNQKALEFGAAASVLKLSIPGDFNRVSRKDVEQLMADQSREVQR